MRPEFMAQAIAIAIENVRSLRGGPFGAVIVKDGHAIATGVNLVTATGDPTAHAEVAAIREACRKLGSFHLAGCDIYASCEPCPMCLGAIYWARLSRLYYAATARDAAEAGFDDSLIYEDIARPRESRRIPTAQLMREPSLEVFREWARTADRIPY